MTTTTTNENGTTVRQDIIAVLDNQSAGAVVWWELHGSINREALLAAWTQAGLNPAHVTQEISDKEALKRAMEQLKGKRMLVRPLGGGTYSLVSERVQDDGIHADYTQDLTASFDDTGAVVFEPSDHAKIQQVRAEFAVQKSQLNARDISVMLLRFIKHSMAVALRADGGFYFVPPAGIPTFRAAAKVLRSISAHQCYEIPAMRSSEAVAAILDAVAHEAAYEIASMEAVLDAGEAGPRALRSQARNCEQAAAKVASYEGLLGTKLTELQAQLESLRNRLVEAALVASTEVDA